MTNEIGDIVISKIESLPFIDKYSGVVKAISYTDNGVKKTFPASISTCLTDCEKNYKDLCPDSGKRSVLFLEDKGAVVLSQEGKEIKWRASYDLVCWLNNKKIGSRTPYSGVAIAYLLKRLCINHFNSGVYQKIKINVIGQKSKGINPFLKYTLEEGTTQYLMWPYDCFVLELNVEFSINKDCIEIETLESETQC